MLASHVSSHQLYSFFELFDLCIYICICGRLASYSSVQDTTTAVLLDFIERYILYIVIIAARKSIMKTSSFYYENCL